MSTPVMVVTESNGIVMVLTRKPDGAMHQCMVLDTSGAELLHQELATLATAMGDRFGWIDAPPAPPTKRVAAITNGTKAKRRWNQPVGRALPRGLPANELRPKYTAEVLAYLAAHPGSTADEIAVAIDMHRPTVHGLLKQACRQGRARHQVTKGNRPRVYWAIANDNDH